MWVMVSMIQMMPDWYSQLVADLWSILIWLWFARFAWDIAWLVISGILGWRKVGGNTERYKLDMASYRRVSNKIKRRTDG